MRRWVALLALLDAVAPLRPAGRRLSAPRRAKTVLRSEVSKPQRDNKWRPFAGLFKRDQLLSDWGSMQRDGPSERAARLYDGDNGTLSLDERSALADPRSVEADWAALRAQLAHLDGDAAGLARIRDALGVAHGAHLGQARRSGEPFIVHPVAVAGLLAGLGMDADTVAAGLLHDTVEDTPVTLDSLERRYGRDVRAIVEGETKVSKLPKLAAQESSLERSSSAPAEHWEPNDRGTPKELEQLENLRQMFVAMTDDYRIIVVKLADRLHNMRTLEHMPSAKQTAIARETLEIFAPLAHRLGIWQFKSELEDTAFRYAKPAAHAQLRAALDARAERHADALGGAREALEAKLRADPKLAGVEASVTGRTKELYSLWLKLERDRSADASTFSPEDLDAVPDLVALRVVLDVPRLAGEGSDAWRERSVWLCYHALALVQRLEGCDAVPRVKDYISFPKPNGYRSLHASVRRAAEDQVVEIQIRTAWMHAVAEHGMAAHWLYKDGLVGAPAAPPGAENDGPAAGPSEKPYAVAWLDSIKDWQHEIRSSREFVETIRREVLGKRVFVFLRDGRILDLSRGATVLDAAFHIHTEVGLRCAKAHINGREVQLGYELRNGDVVSIATSDDARPQLDWLRMAQRRSTRSKLRTHFKEEYRSYLAHIDSGAHFKEEYRSYLAHIDSDFL